MLKLNLSVFLENTAINRYITNLLDKETYPKMELFFEDKDFEEIYGTDNNVVVDSDTKRSIAELAAYVYAFGNDVRMLHLCAVGENFVEIHEKLNDLYDVLFDAFDSFAEMAVSHGESIENPTNIKDKIDWEPVEFDKYDTDKICKFVNEKGNLVINVILNVKEYEPFIQSKIDEFSGEIDKLVNYIFKRTAL